MIKTNNPILQKNIKLENQAIKAAEAKVEAERKKNEELEKKLKMKQPTKTAKSNKIIIKSQRKPFFVRALGWILNTVLTSIFLTTIVLIVYKYVAVPTWHINLGDLPPVLDGYTDKVVTIFNWLWERVREIFSGITNTNNSI